MQVKDKTYFPEFELFLKKNYALCFSQSHKKNPE